MRLCSLSDDVLMCIGRHLECVPSVLRWGCTCRAMRRILTDDELWKRMALHEYGSEFWIRAQRRPADRSLPLHTWRAELLRLERFQLMATRIDGVRISPHRFFPMWEAVDGAWRSKRSQHLVFVSQRGA